MQALTKGSKREEPTMRGLRRTMMGISFLLVGLTSVIWYQSKSVVDYTTKQTSSLHYLGKRLVLLQKIGAQVLTLEATAMGVRPACMRRGHAPLIHSGGVHRLLMVGACIACMPEKRGCTSLVCECA